MVTTAHQTSSTQDITFSKPTSRDGVAMWELVRDSRVLDLNSAYLYILLGHHYSDTCVLAWSDGRLVGMVTGYLPPNRPDLLFIWQIAVSEGARGQGLAKRLLNRLVDQVGPGIRRIETTVTPDNAPSMGLFRKWATQRGWGLDIQEGFPASHFPPGSHEPERLLRIGPL